MIKKNENATSDLMDIALKASASLRNALSIPIIRFFLVATTFGLFVYTAIDPTYNRIGAATLYALFSLIILKWCFLAEKGN